MRHNENLAGVQAGNPFTRWRASSGAVPAMLLCACFSLPVASCAGGDGRSPALPSVSASISGVSVSGFSSGGYMATQFHLAHSERVSGVGVIAGGPYGCAENSLAIAVSRCIDKVSAEIPVHTMIDAAREAAADGRIDKLEYLAGDRAWVFHGALDTTVAAEVTDAVQAFYSELLSADALHYEHDFAAGHTFPTMMTGGPCNASESPYIGDCNYDAAGELLASIVGDLQPSAERSGDLLTFSQAPFAEDLTRAGLAESGYLYLPDACRERNQTCQLHVVFHGCLQDASLVGEAFVRGAGYNQWAESNGIVVLYPQVTRSDHNPYGCWDWWGYTGPDHLFKSGRQIDAVWRMVEHIGGKADSG